MSIKVKSKKKLVYSLIVCFACLLVIIACFLPWTTILFVKFSAFEFGMGALSVGNPPLYYRGMLVFIILPLFSVVQLLIENINKTIFHWIPYFLNGFLILVCSVYYFSMEIGPLFSMIGAVLLCAISFRMRRE